LLRLIAWLDWEFVRIKITLFEDFILFLSAFYDAQIFNAFVYEFIGYCPNAKIVLCCLNSREVTISSIILLQFGHKWIALFDNKILLNYFLKLQSLSLDFKQLSKYKIWNTFYTYKPSRSNDDAKGKVIVIVLSINTLTLMQDNLCSSPSFYFPHITIDNIIDIRGSLH